MKILNCPICKAKPVLEVKDMEQPLGRGYPGCYAWIYRCPKCGLVQGGSDTVYTSLDRVQIEAIKSWNKAVNNMRIIMGKKTIEVKEENNDQT